jgi:Fur family peroxide stress response transcriptional regulator
LKSFQILEALQGRGLRITAPRRAIIEAIDGDRSHPSAEAVLARVRRKRPGISFTTVYATLEALVEQGLLSRVTSDPSRSRFDTVMEAHDHLVCDRCGRIEDVKRGSVPRQSAPRKGFQVRHVRVEYHGICRACHGR